MKTAADVRRRLVPGARLATHYLNDAFGKGDPPVREIMGGSSVLRMEACDWSNGRESRFDIPKASLIEITGPDPFIVRDEVPDGWADREYTFVTEGGPA